MRKPYLSDLAIALAFVIVMTWHPYYLHHEFNLFELGLYLPGIQGIMDGQVPYRDFFYLRGPLDLYIPAVLMEIFGNNVAVLATYFYAGTVITLLFAVLIAHELLPSRLMFFSFVPILVARTFPRVVFTFWGGLRYAWGLAAVWCILRFMRRRSGKWLVAAGILTVAGGLTSIEIGVCAFAAIAAILCWDKDRAHTLRTYCFSIAMTVAPFVIYLIAQNAFVPFLDVQWTVATKLTKVFVQTEPVPSNLWEVINALIPGYNKNFRQMTPVYCYIFFAVYLWWRRKNGLLDKIDKAAAVVALYGLMVYLTGFRNIWSNVFEMSLQPEKIIFFYLVSRLLQVLAARAKFQKLAIAFLVGIVISSLGYSIDRFNKRFLFFLKDPLKGQEAVRMAIPTVKGFVLPQAQAKDIIQLKQFFEQNTEPGDKIWMFPELGSMHFILERPWIGKFPMAILSWIDDKWYGEYMQELNKTKPKYLVANKVPPHYLEKSAFAVEANRQKFLEQAAFIEEHYTLAASTPTYNIYIYN